MSATQLSASAHAQAFTRDAFLERWLGYPVFRLREPTAAADAVATATATTKGEWLIEARVPVDQIVAAGRLTERGFRLIDTNVQLTRPPRAIDPLPMRCRLAAPADESAVRAIAARAFSQTRFHLDPLIPNALANRVKEEWVGNFFVGRRGEWMVVAEQEGRVSGFCQVLRGADDMLVIDLIAVAADARGGGLGAAMIDYAAAACLGRPAAMLVGTQIANTRSLALYTRLGFSVASAAYVFHLHPQDVSR